MSLALSWTDTALLFVLLVCTIMLIRSTRKEQVRQIFKHVLQQPIALSAAIILLFFLMIGVLDSIHLHSSQHKTNHSILDSMLAPLGDTYEQSYSAPFALRLYASELAVVDNQVTQVYPRLKYASHIKTHHDKRVLIVTIVVQSLAVSFIAVLLLGVFLFWKNDATPAHVSCLTTIFILIFLSMASYLLSRQLHILGTGQIGQDIFYYAVKSIRTGLVIGILTTLFMMPVALFLGIAAGYFGGVIDDVIQYIYTTLSSIPGVLLITASVLSIQTYINNHPYYFKTLAQNADAQLLALCAILGMTSWTSLCRLLRAEALKLREIDFVLAAQALGSSSFQIIRKHLLPNVMHIVIITLVLDFSFLILAEAVLSYVGVGVSPLTISWGNMINVARLELARDPIVWWPMCAAFLFMFTLVLASNLFADAVRDAFDPHINHV